MDAFCLIFASKLLRKHLSTKSAEKALSIHLKILWSRKKLWEDPFVYLSQPFIYNPYTRVHLVTTQKNFSSIATTHFDVTHRCWALSKSFIPSLVVPKRTHLAEKSKNKKEQQWAVVRPLRPWESYCETTASSPPLLDHLAANMVLLPMAR